jgi:pyrimidine deaminase RibD-like protein
MSDSQTVCEGSAHEKWMRLALEESWKALPGCRPNPPVGCVVVVDGVIRAKGFTQPPGQPHAEMMALRELQWPLSNSTVYVTLEPCSFQGRTPSCALALVEAKVGRVFVGIIDPHPLNQGRGIEIVRAAGIPVDVGMLASEVEAVLGPYLLRE